MKYLLSICILLAAVFVSYFMIFNQQEELAKSEEQASKQSGGVKQKQWETKIAEEPPVTIEITPIELGPAASQWKFNVIFTTHSGSLDFDPMKAASITDDKGNVSRPIAWQGPGPGGHHREGVLIFNPINPVPKYIKLEITNVGDVAKRTFTWDLE